MKMFVPKEISDTFIPLTIIKLIFGIGDIEYPLGRPRSTLSLIYSGFSFIFIGVLSIMFTKIHNERYGAKLNPNILLFHFIFVYGNLIFYLIAIIMERTYRKEFQQCYEKMNILSKQFETLGITEKHITLFIRNLCLVAILILLNAFLIRALIFMPKQELRDIKTIHFLVFNFCVNVQLTVELHFLALISYFRGKFQQLNNLLQKLTGCESLSMQFEKVFYYKISLLKATNFRLGRKTKDNVKILRTAKEIHLDLVKICEIVNEIFSIQLFISMGISIGLLTIISLDVYRTIFLPLPKYQDKTVVTNVIFAFCLYTMKLLAINHVCYMASEEASYTEIIVFELHEPKTNSEFREELDEFILQLQQNPLIFTAHGFFTLNHNFIQTIVGIVVTYLVIILQLQTRSEQY